jgi:uncharacterized membrane protein
LNKEVKGTIGTATVAVVRIGVHEIKIMKQGMKVGFGLEDVFTFVLRHLILAVHQVNERKASTHGQLASLKRFGNECVILTMSRVSKEVEATQMVKPN